MKTLRNAAFALALILGTAASLVAAPTALAQATGSQTTGVLVLLSPKSGITREQFMAVMPAEIRQTVQLYLAGHIREWYSRSDGRGAVFLLNARDIAHAQTIMDGLPLAKQNLVDHEYIAVGPLVPLQMLVGTP